MRFFAPIVLLTGLLLTSGAMPAQDQAPATVPVPSQAPAEASPQQAQPAPPPSQVQSPPESSNPVLPAATPPPAAKPVKKKPKVPVSAHKVVVRNGGVKDVSPQLAPAMTKEQELQSRETTAQLLATTDANLKALEGRQLTPAQRSLLDQIHTYTKQSKDASESGDLTRARTLAYKAHLLSDELRK